MEDKKIATAVGFRIQDVEGKIPPQALDIENTVIGIVLIDSGSYYKVSNLITSDSFYSDSNRMIWKAITDMVNKNRPVDTLTVVEYLRAANELDIVGGAFYVSGLTSKVASTTNIEYYALIVKQMWMLRELIKIGMESVAKGYDSATDPFIYAQEMQSKISDIVDVSSMRSVRHISPIIFEQTKRYEKAQSEGKTDMYIGIPTGYHELDKILNGLQTGFMIIGARPGMGKTSFVLNISKYVAKNTKKAVVVFSLEMTSGQLVGRLISEEVNIPLVRLEKGELSQEEWGKYNTRTADLHAAPRVLDDRSEQTLSTINNTLYRLKQTQEVGLVVIDYLQLMSSDTTKMSNREQLISSISRGLKKTSKDHDVPVVAIAQLSRELEKRANKRPIQADLRESGSLEQDADVIMFIYRHEYYDPNSNGDRVMIGSKDYDTKGLAEVIIAKNRFGSTGSIALRWVPHLTSFLNYESYDDFEEAAPQIEYKTNVEVIPEDDLPF